MKHTLLFTFSIAMIALVLSSSSGGPSLTGASTAAAGCNNGGSCHGPSNSATVPMLMLIEKGTTDTVKNGEYKPGSTYTVVVSGTNANANGFGFMLRGSHTGGTMQAGSFANPMPASTKTQAVGGFTVFEHQSRIDSMGKFTAMAEWTAPAKGTGDVVMDLSVNGVDGTGTTANDQWAQTSVTLAEGWPASVNDVTKDIAINIYPNPVVNKLNVAITNGSTDTYGYMIYNISGALEQKGYVNSADHSIDVTRLSGGMHVLKLTHDAAMHTMTFRK